MVLEIIMEHEAHVCVESGMHVSSFGVQEPSAGRGAWGGHWAFCVGCLFTYCLFICHNIKQAVERSFFFVQVEDES